MRDSRLIPVVLLFAAGLVLKPAVAPAAWWSRRIILRSPRRISPN